jgi:hypothetical protein
MTWAAIPAWDLTSAAFGTQAMPNATRAVFSRVSRGDVVIGTGVHPILDRSGGFRTKVVVTCQDANLLSAAAVQASLVLTVPVKGKSPLVVTLAKANYAGSVHSFVANPMGGAPEMQHTFYIETDDGSTDSLTQTGGT